MRRTTVRSIRVGRPRGPTARGDAVAEHSVAKAAPSVNLAAVSCDSWFAQEILRYNRFQDNMGARTGSLRPRSVRRQ